jgi:putative Mg2+ transporter-C (MgtC) family protein
MNELFGPPMDMSILDVLLRMALALLFAAVIGWEREASGRAAGLRTHMLVALGAGGFTIIGLEFALASPQLGAQSGDPVKIIEAVAAGIGFLGAGAIIQSRGEVKGLTTAASIWVVAAVGTAAGAGYWPLALLMSGLAFLTLSAVRWLEPPKPEGTD